MISLDERLSLEVGETPKKTVGNGCCFVFSVLNQKSKKLIYLEKVLGFSIISSCLNVNVSVYSATDRLSVCKNQCCKCLIKFKNTSDYLKEVKQELKGIFKGHKLPLSKRLFNKDDNFRKRTFVDLW